MIFLNASHNERLGVELKKKKKTIESSFENLGVGSRKKDAVLWVLRQCVSS